jgi:DNA-binding HxlR family transcriptional regulator
MAIGTGSGGFAPHIGFFDYCEAAMSTLSIETSHEELLVVKPGKWTLVVITRLRADKRRFNELRREITGISQKTLTATLRELERDGFISRTLYPTIPPRVDYELTELGRELVEMADSWRRFARKHRDAVEEARRRFDQTFIGLMSR